MGILQLNPHGLAASSVSHSFNRISSIATDRIVKISSSRCFSKGRIRAVGTVPESQIETATTSEDPPSVKFAFVSSVLLPDGTPDVHFRTACGGQKLRDIMLDTSIELYGPYSRPLLNCGGGGTCATCIVEVVEGKEILSPRTDKEKEKLKRNPKNWRLACQTTVGTPDSDGLVVIQQLPEWKGHEWTYGKEFPSES
ncbi:photosynthetic NDH subunit of subcomplex B 3, chloroplastic-like [Apium graveolens]|uniref:photosynthetic NDH subunit of subcomplex B 3, chloroplastic-like n=1 Tax=Apium graveolens TaxID=4045 RepID=UPI003D797FD9